MKLKRILLLQSLALLLSLIALTLGIGRFALIGIDTYAVINTFLGGIGFIFSILNFKRIRIGS